MIKSTPSKLQMFQLSFLVLLFMFLMSKPALADVLLKSFSDNESVLNFEIDGVTVLTPIEKVAAILSKHGWQEIYEDPANLQGDIKRLRFVKGDFIAPGKYKPHNESRNGYELTITDVISRDHTGIYMMQQTIELNGSSLMIDAPRLNADVLDKHARALQDTVCNGIKDAKEHLQVCSTTSPGRPVYLGLGASHVRLIPIAADGEHEQIAVMAVHEKKSAQKGSGVVTIMHIKRP